MKMKREHFEKMREAIKAAKDKYPNITPLAYTTMKVGKDHLKRHRWDIFTMANVDSNTARWICDNLYAYLTDDHIDTALRKIQAELWPVKQDST